MPRFHRACRFVVLIAVAACHRGGAVNGGDAPALSAFASQRVTLAPTGYVRAADTLGWIRGAGGSRATARLLDSAIVVALDARGLATRWILPAALTHSFERNRTYATDPYQLSLEPLRAASFASGSRYGEPLASQLRTMIALQEDARFVLVPVELRFDRAGSAARAGLRATLVDARTTEAKWVGDVRGDTASSLAAALASVASRLTDYFARP